VTSELGIVQLFDRVLHVLVPQVLHRSRAVLEDVGEADVARLPHVVLQVLPTAGGWQPADYHTILGPASRWSPPTSSRHTSGSSKTTSTTFRKLHSQPVPVVVVAVPGIDRILGVPCIFKLNKGKRWPSPILQIDENNFPVLVEKVFNVFAPYVRGQIAHIYSALTSRVAHCLI